MVSPRIWVSCAAEENAQQGMALAQRLISDLRAAGAEVVSEDAALLDEQFLPFLQRELASCQWFILVQTPQGIGSKRVLLALEEALSCLKGGSLRGVRLINVSSDGLNKLMSRPEMKSYAYNGDYPRLRDKLLLDLGLLQISGVLVGASGNTIMGSQKIANHYQQTAAGNVKTGKLLSAIQLPSLFGSWQQAGRIASQHLRKTTRGDKPTPPRFSLPRPSRRFWLYSLVSIFSLVLIVSGALLAKDIVPAPSPAAITLTHPSPTRAVPTQPPLPSPVPTQPAPTCGPAVSDSFQGNINSGWSPLNNSGQASYTVVSPGTLAMTDPPNADINPTTNENGLGLMQYISNNFTVETQVERPANAPTNGFWAMGLALLLAEGNTDSYFRVEMNTTTFDFEQSINGVFNHDAPAALANANIFPSQAKLRLVRSGNTLSAYYSLPGQSWRLINTINAPLQGQTLQAGLDLVNVTNAPFTGYYNYFSVTCN